MEDVREKEICTEKDFIFLFPNSASGEDLNGKKAES